MAEEAGSCGGGAGAPPTAGQMGLLKERKARLKALTAAVDAEGKTFIKREEAAMKKVKKIRCSYPRVLTQRVLLLLLERSGGIHGRVALRPFTNGCHSLCCIWYRVLYCARSRTAPAYLT